MKLTVAFITKDLNLDFIQNIKHTAETEINIVPIVAKEYKHNGVFDYANRYNNVMEDFDPPYVFIHDDIKFLSFGWDRKIMDEFEKDDNLGVIGLAGTNKIDKNIHWYSKSKKDNLFGVVQHMHNGKPHDSYFSNRFKGLKNVIDISPIFIAVRDNRCYFNSDYRNEEIMSTRFCLDRQIHLKEKIGVTTRFKIRHYDIGEDIHKQEWKQSFLVERESFIKSISHDGLLDFEITEDSINKRLSL